jgi:ABC-2 type transport system ATP-binding protein
MNAIEVSHLRRVFKSNIGVIKRTVKEIVAVDNVSFEIQEGELFGLLGPNGAGKTTTTKMLTTLLIPTEGTASVTGFDVVARADEVRRCIGFIFVILLVCMALIRMSQRNAFHILWILLG